MTVEERRTKERERKARWRAGLKGERLQAHLERERVRASERRRAAGIPQTSRAERARLGGIARAATIVKTVRSSCVPPEVREAYRKAHPNSALVRKYPTWAALERDWPS